MRNIKVMLSYRGTAYHGFQRQNNALGIQNVIEDVLSRILSEKTPICGCSRTDAGVHANMYCFSFRTESDLPCDVIVRGLNALMPEDIAAHSAEDVPEEFHARYSCIAKEYIYLLINDRTRDPFYSDLALFYPYKLDVGAMRRAAGYFAGTHDFTSFCGTANLKDDPVRTIEYFDIFENEKFVKFVVKGDGFLYNMVRIMCGTLLEVSEGKRTPDSIPAILAAKDRTAAGRTAKAHGLYLNKLFY
ncbi:MAG: tRNA pseudouridine(38-40) synthase TruA [Oscillospiraceae bacterium]|nr:tRNA pseudouridine(38-40) synthase TruA [Oscillospiraceae bacterium]